MEHNNAPYKFKHVRKKNYDSSHPLYDAMKVICNPDYNERKELIHMEDAFYGDGLFGEFQDTPHYTLISDLTYEYDKYGNWVIFYLHCVDGLQPDELTIREIEYW